MSWLRRGVVLLAWLYPVGLLASTVVLSFFGENWWLFQVLQYMPRALFALPLPLIAGALFALRMRRLLALQAFSLWLTVFPLMGFVLPGFAGRDPATPVLRVMSYNVNSGFGGEEALATVIKSFSPDVVVLQEATGVAESLTRRLGVAYAFTLVSTQFAIASRYPILSTRDPSRIPHEGRQRSPRFIVHLIDSPLGEIAVYNVHPISPREGFHAIRGQGLKREIASGRLLMGWNSSDLQRNGTLRALQVQAFARQARREPVPVIIAGDTNLPNLSPLLRQELSHFEDGFSAAGWGLGYTFPTHKRVAWMRLDRILASGALRFAHFQTCESRESDHRCVVADLQRRGD